MKVKIIIFLVNLFRGILATPSALYPSVSETKSIMARRNLVVAQPLIKFNLTLIKHIRPQQFLPLTATIYHFIFPVSIRPNPLQFSFIQTDNPKRRALFKCRPYQTGSLTFNLIGSISRSRPWRLNTSTRDMSLSFECLSDIRMCEISEICAKITQMH